MTTFKEALSLAQSLDLEDLLSIGPEQTAVLQDALLARLVELVYEGHPYYRALMRTEGLVPADITSTADLVRLPPTTKRDFLADPDAFRLECPGLPLEMRALWDVVYTTGTSSGVPAPVYTTTFDHRCYMHTALRRAPFVPMREGDVVVSVFPSTPFPMGAYSRVVSETAAFGAALVMAQTGRRPEWFGVHHSLDDAARLVTRHRGTVLWGVASFVRRLLLHAEEQGIDFSSLRLAMVTGEASSSGVLDAMEQRLRRLGARDAVVVNRYGSTEQGNAMVECARGSGFHNLAPDQIFLEVLDAATSARVPDGSVGALAMTHLMRRGTVLLRYLPGDVASLVYGLCPHCGRSVQRMSSDVRREGSIQKVKGTLVDLDGLVARLEALPGVTEFQLVLRATDPEAPDVVNDLLVRYACPDREAQRAVEAVTGLVQEVGRFRPTLDRCSARDIYDHEEDPKARRVVDQRQAARS